MNLTIPYVDSEKIKERLDAAENLKQEALKNEDYEKAAYYRDQIEKYEKLKRSKSRSRSHTSDYRKDHE